MRANAVISIRLLFLLAVAVCLVACGGGGAGGGTAPVWPSGEQSGETSGEPPADPPWKYWSDHWIEAIPSAGRWTHENSLDIRGQFSPDFFLDPITEETTPAEVTWLNSASGETGPIPVEYSTSPPWEARWNCTVPLVDGSNTIVITVTGNGLTESVSTGTGHLPSSGFQLPPGWAYEFPRAPVWGSESLSIESSGSRIVVKRSNWVEKDTTEYFTWEGESDPEKPHGYVDGSNMWEFIGDERSGVIYLWVVGSKSGRWAFLKSIDYRVKTE